MTAGELREWEIRACDALNLRLYSEECCARAAGEEALAAAFKAERCAAFDIGERLRRRARRAR